MVRFDHSFEDSLKIFPISPADRVILDIVRSTERAKSGSTRSCHIKTQKKAFVKTSKVHQPSFGF